jgi:hypothetical protein
METSDQTDRHPKKDNQNSLKVDIQEIGVSV